MINRKGGLIDDSVKLTSKHFGLLVFSQFQKIPVIFCALVRYWDMRVFWLTVFGEFSASWGKKKQQKISHNTSG